MSIRTLRAATGAAAPRAQAISRLTSFLYSRSLGVIVALLAVALLASAASAQNLTTVSGGLVGDGLPPTQASIPMVGEMVFDAAGNLYISDPYHHRVRKLTPGGVLSTFAGTGMSGFSGDNGQAAQAQFNRPYGLVFDGAGNLYVSDQRNNRIRKITPGGVVTTVAGDGTTAVLNAPGQLAIATNGTLYVTESTSHRVRKIVGGVVSPFAGTGTAGSTGDNGLATSALLRSPSDLIVQPDGSVLIADTGNNKIRSVDTGGMITTWRNITIPIGFARDANGVLHVAADGWVKKDDGAGGFTIVAGDPNQPYGGYGGDGGPAMSALFYLPNSIAFASDGRLFISDGNNERIRVVSGGTITTLLGPGRDNEGAAALGARLTWPSGMVYDANGNLYVSERFLNRIRKITPAGVISTYAGTGSGVWGGSSGNGGQAINAQITEPRGLAMLPTGEMLMIEAGNNGVRKIAANGIISEFIPPGNVLLNGADQLVADPSGNVYISTSRYILIVYAGSNTPQIVTGSTTAYRPGGIGWAGGYVYFTDSLNHVVNRVSQNGSVERVAGTPGVSGTDGDGGDALFAKLQSPHGLYVYPDGSFIVGDGSGRLRHVTYSYTRTIETVAGTGVQGFNGDGAALSTQLQTPYVLAADPSGAMMIGDSTDSSLRRLSQGFEPPTISIADASVTEGNSGTKSAVFTVSLTKPWTKTITASMQTSNNLAMPGEDYVDLSQGISFAPGETSKNVSVTINGDTTPEDNEAFFLNVGYVVGANVGRNTAVGNILDDDTPGLPTLSVSDVSLTEGNAGTKLANFTVSLSATKASDVQFNLYTLPGTATAGEDYLIPNLSSSSIPAGQLSTVVSVEVKGDTKAEGDETFKLSLWEVRGAAVAKAVGTATIIEDDAVVPVLNIADATIYEGNSGNKVMTFTVSLSQATTVPVKFDISTADVSATAGSDYVAKSVVGVTIPAGQTTATFSVFVIGDTVLEPREFFVATVRNITGAIGGDIQAGGYINDDDSQLSIADVTVTEGNSGTKNASFVVSLSAASSQPVKFDIATADVSATAGSDYVATSVVGMSIPAGQTSAVFNVPVKGDTTVEPREYFVATVRNIQGATGADIQAGGYINDDDSVLSVSDVSVTEGNSGTKNASFVVSLSAASSLPVKFDIATADVSATAGSDYVATSVVGMTIPAGQTSVMFNVPVKGDTIVEPRELFVATARNIVGATGGDIQGGGYINDDDSILSIADVSVIEGNSGTKNATFVISLSAASSQVVKFDIATADVTALAGSDYVATSATGMSIGAGQTSVSFNVPIKGDTVKEPQEYFVVTLRNIQGATGGDIQAGGYIVNDDAATLNVARFDARGLYDDIDDGHREPQLSGSEYARLLLDTAKSLCARTPQATVVAVDAVENRAVLRELADTANSVCAAKPNFQAVMGTSDAPEGSGFLVSANEPGLKVVGAPTRDAKAGLTVLAVQAGALRPVTLLLADALPPAVQAAARTARLSALAARVQRELAADPQAQLLVLGELTMKGLVDLTARDWAAKSKPGEAVPPMPSQRLLASPQLLEAFDASRIDFPARPAGEAPAQVLQLR